MRLIDIVNARLETYLARRRYRRNAALIAALPPEIRRDIGWPGSARGVQG